MLDVIIPTANVNRYPAIASISHNRKSTLEHDNVHFIPIESSGPSFSFAKSVNEGIHKSRYPNSYIFLLNDDCFLDDGWIEAFMSAVQCHPESGIFGALLRFPRNATGNWLSGKQAANHRPSFDYQHAGGYIPTTNTKILVSMLRYAVWGMAPFWIVRNILNGTGFRFPGHYHTLNPRHRIHLITAAAMLITPDCIQDVGLFDESYPLAFEDTDYCLRALEKHWNPCLVTHATGVHHESMTTRHLEERKRASFRVFCEKWPLSRIRNAVNGHRGIVHPIFCDCNRIHYES